MDQVLHITLLCSSRSGSKSIFPSIKIFLLAQNIDNTMRTVNQRNNNEPEIHEGYCESQKFEVSYSNEPIRD